MAVIVIAKILAGRVTELTLAESTLSLLEDLIATGTDATGQTAASEDCNDRVGGGCNQGKRYPGGNRDNDGGRQSKDMGLLRSAPWKSLIFRREHLYRWCIELVDELELLFRLGGADAQEQGRCSNIHRYSPVRLSA
jgi:hypothetical protein